MYGKGQSIFQIAGIAIIISSVGANGNDGRVFPPEMIPDPPREFRAAWVATVHNLDWPSRPGLPVSEMKSEATSILDRLVELNMNAVVFQVRPQSDALYQSDLEPWSWYLTGKQGLAPADNFDPLQFWIEESHARGIQLHAWFNPYRALHFSHQGKMSDQFIVKSKPEAVVKLRKKGFWWLIPTSEAARQHTLDVVMDVVKRYDIDGVHFDDYFYPYPAYNYHKRFPDSKNFTTYKHNGGTLQIGDWRRDAVNRLVEDLSIQIKEEKPHVEFGISPFGIWRPGHPKGTTGLDQYRVLYADARLWFSSGWVDYLTPQLYWPIKSKRQSFPALLGWWSRQNMESRHLWPGLKIGKSSSEVINQINIVREMDGTNSGMCLFSVKKLMRNDRSTAKMLREGPWSGKAIIPSSPWIPGELPLSPEVEVEKHPDNSHFVKIRPKDENYFQLLINKKRNGIWLEPEILASGSQNRRFAPDVEAVAVRVVDRSRRISHPAVVYFNPPELDLG